MNRKFKIFTVITLAIIFMGAVTSQVNTYVNGNTLTADQLNSEFGNLYSTINNLDDANFSASPALDPAKIASTVAGDGLARDVGTGVLSVGVDGSTVELNSDVLRVKDLGITTAKIAADAVTSAKIPSDAIGATEIATDAVGAAEISANAVTASEIATSAVATAEILDGTILAADLSANAVATGNIVDNTVAKADLAVKTTSSSASLGNVALSASTGASEAWVVADPDELIATVTLVSQGGPVMIQLLPAPDVSDEAQIHITSGRCAFEIRRDGSTVGSMDLSDSGSGDDVYYSPGSIAYLDAAPSAGSHTYSVVINTVCDGTYAYVRLMAYEL